MKIRQTYVSGNDVITVQFLYNKIGLIAEMREVATTSDLEDGEYNVPKVEVTADFFCQILNNPKLK